MILFGSCIYPTLGSVKVSPSRVASPENYQHQSLKCPELPPITLIANANSIVNSGCWVSLLVALSMSNGAAYRRAQTITYKVCCT